MNLAEWHRHSFLNRLQSLLLIGFMAGFLALLGHLIWGPEGMLQLLVFGVILALVNPVSSPWLVLRLYRARPLRSVEGRRSTPPSPSWPAGRSCPFPRSTTCRATW